MNPAPLPYEAVSCTARLTAGKSRDALLLGHGVDSRAGGQAPMMKRIHEAMKQTPDSALPTMGILNQ